mmetsp:Transcript_233/g.545  ORF Transcript_233/g.545 Transcript_233/m.545 type:complete len:705 (+) Transcript_233:68-2182(+)
MEKLAATLTAAFFASASASRLLMHSHCPLDEMCCGGIEDHGELTFKCKPSCAQNQGFWANFRDAHNMPPKHNVPLLGDAAVCCSGGEASENAQCLEGLADTGLLPQMSAKWQWEAAAKALHTAGLSVLAAQVASSNIGHHLDPLLLPCIGLEGETSTVQMKTKQKPILELEVRSLCMPNYPLFQITGDMGDDWRTMELITGPVPAVPELLEDMHLLYQTVFDLIMVMNEQQHPDVVLVSADEEFEPPEAVVGADFQRAWSNLVPRLFAAFSEKGLRAHIRSSDVLENWIPSTTATGKHRSKSDFPVIMHGAEASRRQSSIGLQATFEVPLDFGRHWHALMRPLFIGTWHRDWTARLAGAIHIVANSIGEALASDQQPLRELMAGGASHSEGIMASILHFLAHFALEQAADDQLAAHHDDDHIDVAAMSCDVARKNDMILNPRFDLKGLLYELDIALASEQDTAEYDSSSDEEERLTNQAAWEPNFAGTKTAHRSMSRGAHKFAGLRTLLIKAFGSLSETSSKPAQLLRDLLSSRLTLPGASAEICVRQSGLTGCMHWVGVDQEPSSRMPTKHCGPDVASREPCYELNVERYLRRVLEAVRQTLELASDDRRRNYLHGCGHPISPTFRSHRGRKFARFEDRGTGRVATLLQPKVVKNRFEMPNEEDRSQWHQDEDLSSIGHFHPFELAAGTILRPTFSAYRVETD